MENTILFSLMTKTMENTMCSSSDDVDDEDYMENTMCSSSDDVDDENYWKNEKMENTMCSSSDDVDGEDLLWRLKTKVIQTLKITPKLKKF